jgi:hypothetical protein
MDKDKIKFQASIIIKVQKTYGMLLETIRTGLNY